MSLQSPPIVQADTLCLTEPELRELTGKARRAAQQRELDHMGVPYSRRRDGSIVVIRGDVRSVEPTAARRPRLRLP